MKDMSSRRHGDKNVGVDIQSRVNSGDKHDSNSTAFIQPAMGFKKKDSQILGDNISVSEKGTAQWVDK
ncbi:hypothetical protein I79_005985 [Cricetulus griseus]|uniref:Uncharacterized protein n=1 Tax=Cricetulus griseus TaxID=10029 RepID=G3H6M0_CRIGR|nr:hypothetical protein I79_005985 [Cricetulus griseus]